MTSARRWLPLVLLAAVGSLASCGGSTSSSGKPPVTVNSPASDSGFRGATFSPARLLPPLALTDTAGRKWNLEQHAQGRITVIYFGYTNCPDTCPTDMADLATARRSLPEATRSKVDVVFITVDRRRDTAAVMRKWLDRFDKDFVGLTGTAQQLTTTAHSLGIAYRVQDTKQGLEQVEHSSLMTAFSQNGTSRLAWLDGTSPVDIAHDMTLLAEGEIPA